MVNRLLEDNIPKAVTTKMLQQETSSDEELQQLTKFIQSQDKDGCKKNLKEYSGVFDELYTINGIILRDQQIVIPKSLRADVIELAHEGHQGIDKTLKLLRQSSWFPKMGDLVKQFVESCIPCLASNPHITPVPLEPNVLPDQPWQRYTLTSKDQSEGNTTCTLSLTSFPSTQKWTLSHQHRSRN